jgi:steroid 5-alpha reductase family enzyme
MKNMRKIKDLFLILLIYIVAFLFGFIAFVYAYDNWHSFIIAFLLFDVIATLIVWISGVMLNNSSVYDPYWSVAPLFILFITWAYSNFNLVSLFLLVPIFFWGIRLTINWIITFKNLSIQDWRYQMYQNKYPKLWFIINLFGINMMPTVLVFASTIPGIIFISTGVWNYFSLFGVAFILCGTLLELFSDHHMHKFLKIEQKSGVCKVGLWKYSRHPNYLGEISIWFGVYFIMLFSNLSYWHYFVGALLILFLFLFISIPLMEKRQISKRPDYVNYRKSTSTLLILPNKKAESDEELS